MRILIRHETTFRYERPALGTIHTLRLTPRNHEGQYVTSWRLDVDRNCRLQPTDDAFGNPTHTFSLEGPIESLTILAEGEVETQDTAGILRGSIERFPRGLWLRATPLTAATPSVAAFADGVAAAAAGPDALSVLHALLAAVHERIELRPDHPPVPAAEALAAGHGSATDLAHLFAAAARHLGHPARIVTGFHIEDAVTRVRGATDVWAEAEVERVGWVGFDPARKLCPTESHVRLAVGLDHVAAQPVRGSFHGIDTVETMERAVFVTTA